MEKLKIIAEDTKNALGTLKEIMEMPYSVIIRDAAIQRFEYSFEIFWKFLKEYLRVKEGIICNSPKSCFREAFNVKLLTEQETVTALEMTDDRNLTAHTYHEEVAEEIYRKIKNYYKLMDKVYRNLIET
ncbi:MAG: HI0074 family nucleotidyltransferase substrate-binding subunit [Candidatus Methanoperedens sp.]|nr:HI0074 family nucleotidyltransferase substrate-binding subunit [Candidatus Methanoperedens sp.]MCZ7406456.1 HI0074 family nucleotidyltransferase substrate-binding subunit [Candidatus Methanoperedens sp.]